MPRTGPNQYSTHTTAVQPLSGSSVPLSSWSQDAQLALLPPHCVSTAHRFIKVELGHTKPELPAFRIVRDTIVTIQLVGHVHSEYRIDGLDIRFKTHNATQAVATFIASIFGKHTISAGRCGQPIVQLNIL